MVQLYSSLQCEKRKWSKFQIVFSIFTLDRAVTAANLRRRWCLSAIYEKDFTAHQRARKRWKVEGLDDKCISVLVQRKRPVFIYINKSFKMHSYNMLPMLYYCHKLSLLLRWISYLKLLWCSAYRQQMHTARQQDSLHNVYAEAKTTRTEDNNKKPKRKLKLEHSMQRIAEWLLRRRKRWWTKRTQYWMGARERWYLAGLKTRCSAKIMR